MAHPVQAHLNVPAGIASMVIAVLIRIIAGIPIATAANRALPALLIAIRADRFAAMIPARAGKIALAALGTAVPARRAKNPMAILVAPATSALPAIAFIMFAEAQALNIK